MDWQHPDLTIETRCHIRLVGILYLKNITQTTLQNEMSYRNVIGNIHDNTVLFPCAPMPNGSVRLISLHVGADHFAGNDSSIEFCGCQEVQVEGSLPQRYAFCVCGFRRQSRVVIANFGRECGYQH